MGDDTRTTVSESEATHLAAIARKVGEALDQADSLDKAVDEVVDRLAGGDGMTDEKRGELDALKDQMEKMEREVAAIKRDLRERFEAREVTA